MIIKEKMNNKVKWKRITVGMIYIIIIIVVLMTMSKIVIERIGYTRIDNNNCLEEEMVYYIMEGGIFVSKIVTTKENADGIDYRCIKWEEEPSFGKSLLGQKLVYEKGSLINRFETGDEK